MPALVTSPRAKGSKDSSELLVWNAVAPAGDPSICHGIPHKLINVTGTKGILALKSSEYTPREIMLRVVETTGIRGVKNNNIDLRSSDPSYA
jgi:hypothetical protein